MAADTGAAGTGAAGIGAVVADTPAAAGASAAAVGAVQLGCSASQLLGPASTTRCQRHDWLLHRHIAGTPLQRVTHSTL